MAKRKEDIQLKPSKTDKGQEDMLIALAEKEAEKRLRDGSASNSLILHYLREGSEKTKLERQKLESENELLKAKKTTLDIAAKDHDQLARVLDAFKLYSGDDNE
jgi:hypothetical protein